MFEVYIHVPFCMRRCGYCDFNTYTAVDMGEGASRGNYANMVIREMAIVRDWQERHGIVEPPADTVFFGGGTPTILKAADLVAMLEDNGYEVVGEAANGEEAVDLTRKFRPDIVCMDVKMPRMDGIAAAGVICDENIAPVVMLTAFSQPDLVRQATGAGAMAYVTKPYEESKLLPTLEVAMGRFAEINDLLDSVERSERKLKETTDQLRETEEKLKKAEDTLEERKLVDRAKGLLMDKADFSEQGAFRWIQKTSMDQRIPKKRLAMAIIAKYGEQKSEAEDER